jgi:DNA adenine methylase
LRETARAIRSIALEMISAAVSAQQPLPWDAEPGTSRPFLKWAGGKRQLLPELLRHAPKRFGVYYEPFVGGAALFFALGPRRAVLGDFNERLARTYRGVRNGVDDVISLLRSYPHSRAFFNAFRKQDVDGGTDADVAAWLLYLNRTAYNGLYRVNRQNRFNTPFGSYKNPTICDANLLRECSSALRAADIRVSDFEMTVAAAREGDFVYFDPPYVPVSEFSDFTRYTTARFSLDDQVRLRDVALRLKRRGVSVLLSNSSAPLVRELYSEGFQIREVQAARQVNCRAEKRGKILELLIH